ncbi:MAG: hypothetical protein HY898_04495 [Deltaproteobacteria bacterium]|nr:hypothetical protein [Deltaproteobacteria bacterium]
MKRLSLACSINLVILAMAAQSVAADWHAGPAGKKYPGIPAVAARAYLAEYRAPLSIQGVDLVAHTTLPVFDSHTVRFGQTYGGLPVFRSAIAVRVGPEGEIKTAVVDIARDLSVSTLPSVDEASVRSLVGQWAGRVIGDESTLELGVMGNRHGGALVWRVDVLRNDGAHRYEVDAHTGKLIQQYHLAVDLNMARVYEINNLKTPTPVDKELLHLTVTTPQELTGAEGTVARYISGDLEAQPPKPLVVDPKAVVPDANGDFLFDPINGWAMDDSFAEVNVYYHLDRMNFFFRDTLKVDMSAVKWSLLAVPHYAPNQQPYQNAFYSPSKASDGVKTYYNMIVIGGTKALNWAYDSDVFLHEYTHYMNHNAIGFSEGVFSMDEYGLVTMPGSIDEGTADYFACSANNDAVEGEASLGQGARDLNANPGKCPDVLFGETHMDGELIGSAAWAVRKELGAEIADPLNWGASSMLTTACTLGDWAKNVQDGMAELKTAGKITDAQIQKVNDAIHLRGLDDCSRFLSVDEKTSRRTNMIGLDLVGQYMGGSCSMLRSYGFALTSLFHFKYQSKSADKGVKFTVDLKAIMGGGSDWDWDMVLRKNDPVTFISNPMGMSLELDQHDYKLEHIDKATGEFTIDDKSNPPFDPTATYYMVIFQRNCPTSQATVKAAGVVPVPDAGPDAPPDVTEAGPIVEAGADSAEPTEPAADGSVEGGSCGCRTVGGANGATLAGMMLSIAAIAAARSRRRR